MFNKTIIAALLATVATTATAADCEYGEHDITITAADSAVFDLACGGAIKAIQIFEDDLGYDKLTYTVDVNIEDEVYYLKPGDPDYRVFGIYDTKIKSIQVSSPTTDYAKERFVFIADQADKTTGLAMTDELWASIVTHEVSHSITDQIWIDNGGLNRSEKLGGGAQEFVAYIVQLMSLSDETREQVLNQYPDSNEGFDNKMKLNSLYHMHFPHKYGVIAYNTFTATGTAWIQEIMNGDLDPDLKFTNGTY